MGDGDVGASEEQKEGMQNSVASSVTFKCKRQERPPESLTENHTCEYIYTQIYSSSKGNNNKSCLHLLTGFYVWGIVLSTLYVLSRLTPCEVGITPMYRWGN